MPSLGRGLEWRESEIDIAPLDFDSVPWGLRGPEPTRVENPATRLFRSLGLWGGGSSRYASEHSEGIPTRREVLGTETQSGVCIDLSAKGNGLHFHYSGEERGQAGAIVRAKLLRRSWPR